MQPETTIDGFLAQKPVSIMLILAEQEYEQWRRERDNPAVFDAYLERARRRLADDQE